MPLDTIFQNLDVLTIFIGAGAGYFYAPMAFSKLAELFRIHVWPYIKQKIGEWKEGLWDFYHHISPRRKQVWQIKDGNIDPWRWKKYRK